MMAAAPGALPPATDRGNLKGSTRNRFYGLIRAVRADVQDVQASIDDLSGAESTSSRFAELILQAQGTMTRNKSQIQGKLGDLSSLLDDDANLSNYGSDELERIRNLRLRIVELWDRQSAAGAIAQTLPALSRLSKDLVYTAGLITIPQRVNEHLASYRVGQSLDFNQQFGDELPDAGQRKQMLEYLYSHPLAVQGIVDVPSGLIYRASPRPARRLVSFVLIAAAAVTGALIFGIVLPGADWIPNFPEVAPNTLVVAYLFALVGSLIHLAADALKQVREARASTTAQFLAVDSWALWIHVRELYFCAGVVFVGIAAFGVIATTKRTDPLTMLLAGYSWDSLQDIFIPRLMKSLGTRSEALVSEVKK